MKFRSALLSLLIVSLLSFPASAFFQSGDTCYPDIKYSRLKVKGNRLVGMLENEGNNPVFVNMTCLFVGFADEIMGESGFICTKIPPGYSYNFSVYASGTKDLDDALRVVWNQY